MRMARALVTVSALRVPAQVGRSARSAAMALSRGTSAARRDASLERLLSLRTFARTLKSRRRDSSREFPFSERSASPAVRLLSLLRTSTTWLASLFGGSSSSRGGTEPFQRARGLREPSRRPSTPSSSSSSRQWATLYAPALMSDSSNGTYFPAQYTSSGSLIVSAKPFSRSHSTHACSSSVSTMSTVYFFPRIFSM